MPFPLLLAALAAAPPSDLPRYPPCGPRVEGPCIVPPAPLSRAALERLMAGRSKAWWISGDVLTLVARPPEEWAVLCCSLQTVLEPIPGSDLATISVRVPDMERAIFDVNFMPGTTDRDPPVYRGPRAPPAPARVAALAGRVETHVLQSAALGATRSIHVYVPPGLGEARDVPVVYLGDGGSPGLLRIAERMIADGRIRPVIVVGIDAAPGGLNDAMPDGRSLEYIPWLDRQAGETRYERHRRFVTDEVLPFVEAHYPVARDPAGRAIGGWSSGGIWSLAMAADRPDLFGNLISFSGSGLLRPFGQRLRRGRAFFAAGTFEAPRDLVARTVADAAREAGADVQLRILPAGHGFEMWEIDWAEALAWMFRPEGRGSRR